MTRNDYFRSNEFGKKKKTFDTDFFFKKICIFLLFADIIRKIAIVGYL